MTMFDKFELNEHGPDFGKAPDASAAHQAATAIPPELERAAADAGANIRSRFQSEVSQPNVAKKTARVFLSVLRGPRKKAGRKPYPSTTEAVRLLTGQELRDTPKSKRWPIIYKRVIPDWPQLTPEQRSGAERQKCCRAAFMHANGCGG